MTSGNKKIIYILIAFVFSIAVRLIWVYQFQDTEQFKFNNQFMINTNDGYAWAEGTRDIVNGITKNSNDLSPRASPISILTAFLVKILPFSIEAIIFYMPAFFASLIVIPIILIGKMLGRIEIGFIAALFGSIAWSYYNRTMVGYYDTDLLNIVFPTFLLWTLIWAIKIQEDRYLLYTALDIMAYRWWYPQSYSLEFAFFGLVGIYVLYQYIKKEYFKYNLLLMTFMMFAMLGLDILIKFMIVVLLFIALKLKRKLVLKYLYYLFILSLILFMATGGFNPILAQLKGYVFKDTIDVTTDDISLHFFTVMQTIRESGQISFETFANRISGDTITFIFSIIGYIWLTIRNPIMLLGLPMIGLGFLAYNSGLRFTVYAVPILALGISFLIFEVSKWLSTLFVNKYSKNIFIIIFTILAIFPNIIHIINYKVPTVFTKDEVFVLDKLKKNVSREDYIVGWWDYGYPIRYYADVKTLSDGAKHSGDVNFPTSFILTHPQDVASKMLRLDVEYTEKRFNIIEEEKNKWQTSNIGQMMLDYGFKNTNDFLLSLETDIKLPKKTRDIYLYLPNKMLNIYPTVTLFSNINLMTGKKGKPPFFYKTRNYLIQGNIINLGRGIMIDTTSNSLILGKTKVVLKTFTKTFYDKNGVLQKQVQTSNPYGNFHAIFMSNYGQFLVVDDSVYNSLYFQLFVLENYDHTLFDAVNLTPLVKIYKLKI